MKVKLTEEQIANYKRTGGVKCPRCKSPNVTTDSVQIDGPTGYANCVCADCHLEWVDQWVFNGLDPDNVADDQPEPEENKNEEEA